MCWHLSGIFKFFELLTWTLRHESELQVKVTEIIKLIEMIVIFTVGKGQKVNGGMEPNDKS